ncbi:MAG: hypothetical protein ABJ327_24545 [Litoreibacter sp.]
MKIVTDHANHESWTTEVVRILDTEFGAATDIQLPEDETLNRGFAPVGHWFANGLAPLSSTIATLYGDAPLPSVQPMRIFGHDADLAGLEYIIQAQLRYNFGFDAYFDAMHRSALDFAAENETMITEHFGSAANYAEYYAETSCETMGKIAAQGLNKILAARIITAFGAGDVAAWAACFPGSYVRGILTSYAIAQGPVALDALATTLKKKLNEAFSLPDTTEKMGEENGPK